MIMLVVYYGGVFTPLIVAITVVDAGTGVFMTTIILLLVKLKVNVGV